LLCMFQSIPSPINEMHRAKLEENRRLDTSCNGVQPK
jgi:hypothetical protein